MHASERKSEASQAYSTATCGRSSPRYEPWATLSPSTPTETCLGSSFGFLTSMSCGGVRRLTRKLERTFFASVDAGFERFARDADGELAVAVGVTHSGLQHGGAA